MHAAGASRPTTSNYSCRACSAPLLCWPPRLPKSPKLKSPVQPLPSTVQYSTVLYCKYLCCRATSHEPPSHPATAAGKDGTLFARCASAVNASEIRFTGRDRRSNRQSEWVGISCVTVTPRVAASADHVQNSTVLYCAVICVEAGEHNWAFLLVPDCPSSKKQVSLNSISLPLYFFNFIFLLHSTEY